MNSVTLDLVFSTGRKLIVLCLISFFSSLLYGAEVDSLKAKAVAKNFYLTRLDQSGIIVKKASPQDISFDLVHAVYGDPDNQSLLKNGGVPLPLYYIFNAGDGGGYVIVPGDDRVPVVLGFSFEGSYSTENQSPAFMDLMTSYKKQIIFIIENNLAGSEENQELWKTFGSAVPDIAPAAVQDVAPLIETRWNQGCYYNYFCPEDAEGPCGRVYAGCLAVAVAQIINYWEHPANVDYIPGYTHSTYGWIDEINDIDYNWLAMTNTLNSSSSQQAVDAVAGLLYHVGVSVEMNYSAKGSAGSSSRALSALQNIFNYSTASEFIPKFNYSNSQWDQIIRNELDSHRPVYSQGSTEDGSGCHAFVLDGYSGTNYFHINWGWGGYRDGYFYLDPLSENSSLYSYQQWAIIGLEPYSLDVSPDSRTVSSEQGTATFSVNSNMDWSVEDDAAWLTATKTSETNISVSFSENATSSSRTANIRVYAAGGVEETVNLTQLGGNGPCPDAYEPNEYFPSAASPYPTLGTDPFTRTISATIDDADDQDYYRLDITHPGTVTIRLPYPPIDIDMALARGPEEWLTNSLGVGNSSETMTWQVTSTGTYHIYVYAAYDDFSCTNYNLEVEWYPVPGGYLYVTPNSRNVGSAGGSTSFSVECPVNWAVEDDASWLTATKTDDHTISVSYAANTSGGARTAEIRAFGPGDLEDKVTVVQDSPVPTCPDIYEENNSFGTAASPYPTLGASNYSGTIGATIHNASDDDYYRVYASSQGTLTVNLSNPPIDIDLGLANGSGEWLTNSVNTETSSESMTWHVSSPGYYYIYAYGYDGASSCTDYHLGVVWSSQNYLDVSPNSQSTGYDAGTATFSVNSNVDWSVEDDASWLTASRSNSSTISVSFSENTSSSSRIAQIRAYSNAGVEETVTFTQSGTTQSCADAYEPNEYFNEATSPYPTLGTSAYTGSISATMDVADDQDYYRLNVTALGTLTVHMPSPPVDIDLALAAGTEQWLTNSLGVGTSSETMTWEVTSTGSYYIYAYAAYDEYSCNNYNLEVQWVPATPDFLNVTPESRTVSAESGATTFSVNSNINWSVIDNASWLTATKTNENTISVSFNENISSSSRTAQITVSGGGLEESVSVTQLEVRKANLSYHPDYNDLSVSGTEVSLSIRIINNGAATAQESYVGYYLSSDATVSTSDYLIGEDYVSGIVSGAYSDESLLVDATSANPGIPGGSYFVGYVIDYQSNVEESSEADNSYLFNAPKISVPVHLKVSPSGRTVDPAAGSTSFVVNSNVDWSVEDDADWLTATRSGETGLVINFTENSSPSARTAQILVSGGGVTETVTVTQKEFSLPNLAPFKNTGWDDKVVVSAISGTKTDGDVQEGQTSYIDFAWKNIGEANAISHVSCLYVDDQQIKWIEFPGLTAGYSTFVEDMEFIFNESGWHTIKLVVDVNNNVQESEEGDNEFAKQIYVKAPNSLDDNVLEDGIQVFPNPTGGKITLRIQDARQGRFLIEIVDPLGRVVGNRQIDNRSPVLEESFDIHGNHPGMYFLKISCGEYHKIRKVILKD